MTTTTGQATLGKYVLVREIARSNDIVWEATDPQMKRRVAVKELNMPPTLTGQARRERIERFYREARAAGAMNNHPNIVTIHEMGEDRGRFFIAMEFLDGQTLRDRLQIGGALPVQEAAHIISSLCDALDYAHKQGVIHRDIKPDNIFLLPGNRVKLTDFGIARITEENQLTVAGQVFGTPSYMSPEQVIGKSIDARSDLFSLGILLYEMVTGRKPFTGDSVVTITYHIMHDPTPSALGVSPAVDAVIQRATAKNPADRFASAADFRAALQAATSGQNRTVGPFPAAAAPSLYAPPPSAYPAATQQATAYYGAQTQQNVAPGYAPAAMQPPTPYQPAPQQQPLPVPAPVNNGANRTATLAAVTVLIVLILFVGGGLLLSRAYKNYNGQVSMSQGNDAYNKAAALYTAGDFENAARAFEQIRLSPGASGDTVRKATEGELFCYRQLGHAAQTRSDWASAEKWYNAALTVAPGDAQAKTELGFVQKYRGSVAPAPSATPDTTSQVTTEFPKPLAPGAPNVSANDFTNANNQAASQAATLFQKGEEARQKGDMTLAIRYWTAALAAGPGSPGAQQAQQAITKYNSEHNPLDYGN